MATDHDWDNGASWDEQKLRAILNQHKDAPGALTLILRHIQDELGWLPPASVPLIARTLQLSRAEVHGVISFYHDFRHTPPGRHVIRVCRAESCQAMGAAALAEHIQRRLGLKFGETRKDGRFSLEPVYCLGNCACSPALMIDQQPLGRMTPEGFDRALADLTEPAADLPRQ